MVSLPAWFDDSVILALLVCGIRFVRSKARREVSSKTTRSRQKVFVGRVVYVDMYQAIGVHAELEGGEGQPGRGGARKAPPPCLPQDGGRAKAQHA